ncbi:ATP-binding cassette domain-containing protein, partial [candidate division KSB1 bacterium]
MKALKCTELIKKYPGFQLGPINLEMEPGTVLGYIGPNGAGKTTTMHCIMGLVSIDGGNVELFGQPNDHNKPDWKNTVGYVGDAHPFYMDWPALKNLEVFSKMFSEWDSRFALSLVKKFKIPIEK